LVKIRFRIRSKSIVISRIITPTINMNPPPTTNPKLGKTIELPDKIVIRPRMTRNEPIMPKKIKIVPIKGCLFIARSICFLRFHGNSRLKA
jgi:hypothetical protein